MLDWKFADETEDLPDLPDELTSRWQPTQRGWLTIVGIVVLLLGIGTGAVLWRLHDRQQAMRADLTAHIYREDQVRFAGLIDRAGEFEAQNVPAEWRERYRATFTPMQMERLRIDSIRLEGTEATVTLHVDDHEQVRRYRLEGQTWRRVPVPATLWGDREMLHRENFSIAYRSRNSAVAQRLADRLPVLLDAIADWQYRPTLGLVVIEPRDLHAPLLSMPEWSAEVVLNTPELVPYNGVLSGDATVRLALAEALFRRAGGAMRQELGTQIPLSGSGRFFEAARTVSAVHASLTTTETRQVVAGWRAALGDTWISPFYAPMTTTLQTLSPQPADAAMLLLADHIYRAHGSATLRAIIQRPGGTGSWDAIFTRTIGRTTAQVEREAAQHAGVPAPERVEVIGSGTVAGLTADLIETDGNAPHRLLVRPLPDGTPFRAEVAATHARVASNTLRLAVGCVGAGSRVQLAGSWLETGQRLQATDVVVQALALPTVFTLHDPPSDTIAYLLDTTESSRLVALRRDGTRAPLLEPTDDGTAIESVTPFYVDDGRTVRVLIDVRTSECSRQLSYVYEPGAGVIAAWVMHQTPREPIWRSDHEDFLITRGVSARIGHYGVLNDEDGFTAQTVTPLGPFLLPRRWSEATQRLLVEDIRRDTESGEAIHLFDPGTGDIRRLTLAKERTSYHLTADGRWLAYLVRSGDGSGVADKLHLRQLDAYLNTIPIQVRAGHGLHLVAQRYPPDSRIVLWTGPVEDGRLVASRLLVIDPEAASGPITVDERVDGILTASVLCADGRILYTVEQQNRSTLMQNHPARASPQPLLELAPGETLIACPGLAEAPGRSEARLPVTRIAEHH